VREISDAVSTASKGISSSSPSTSSTTSSYSTVVELGVGALSLALIESGLRVKLGGAESGGVGRSSRSPPFLLTPGEKKFLNGKSDVLRLPLAASALGSGGAKIVAGGGAERPMLKYCRTAVVQHVVA